MVDIGYGDDALTLQQQKNDAYLLKLMGYFFSVLYKIYVVNAYKNGVDDAILISMHNKDII